MVLNLPEAKSPLVKRNQSSSNRVKAFEQKVWTGMRFIADLSGWNFPKVYPKEQ